MDGYEQEIERQAGGPFTSRQERKTIRRVAEHWIEGQRYSAERRKRWQTYAWWGGLIGPALLAAIKFAESLLTKGS